MQKEANEFQFTMEDLCSFNLFDNQQDNKNINNTQIDLPRYQNATQSRFAETIEDNNNNDSNQSSNLSQENDVLNFSSSSNDESFNKLSHCEQDQHKVIFIIFNIYFLVFCFLFNDFVSNTFKFQYTPGSQENSPNF